MEVEDDYFNISDEELKQITFDKKFIRSLQEYDKTINIIGYVENCELRQTNNLRLYKFNLTNKLGDIIQVLIWDSEIIDRVKELIMAGNCLYISGAFAKKRSNLSAGNIQYDLILMSNSVVRMIRETPIFEVPNPNNNLQLKTLAESVDTDGTIAVIAYIKNPIQEITVPYGKLNQGVLSDCTNYKMEIRIQELGNMTHFGVGCHVRVIGSIKYSHQLPYLWVLKKDDITLESDTMKNFKELRKGSLPLKRSSDCCKQEGNF